MDDEPIHIFNRYDDDIYRIHIERTGHGYNFTVSDSNGIEPNKTYPFFDSAVDLLHYLKDNGYGPSIHLVIYMINKGYLSISEYQRYVSKKDNLLSSLDQKLLI